MDAPSWLPGSYSKKNKEPWTPSLLTSSKKVYWRCTNKPRHHYKCTTQERIRRYGFQDHNGCPRCIFYGEEVVMEWLRSQNISYEHEKTFPWSSHSRFDLFVEPNILLEIDGLQHFVRRKRRWEPPSEIRRKDVIKMNQAFSQGFHVIRIYQQDLLDTSHFDWRSVLKDTFDLLKTKTTQCLWIISSDEDVYNHHINEL
jgi:hypothetical protein